MPQVGYCRAGNAAGHYVLFEHYSNYQCTQNWWLWKRSTTIENKGCDISFSGTTRYDDMATKTVTAGRLATHIAGRAWVRHLIPRNNISREPEYSFGKEQVNDAFDTEQRTNLTRITSLRGVENKSSLIRDLSLLFNAIITSVFILI